MYKHTLTILKNGLRLIMVPMPQVESLTVLVGVGAGSRYETRRINGLSHFLEHMAFKGTKKRPSTLAIASEIDGVGGEFNAYTDKEFTGYFIKLAAKHQELAFDILSDMLTNSLLKQEEIDREKGVIFEEINMREDVPMTKVAVTFERLLYGDNPMGWDIAGEKEIVKNINRKDFLNYVNRLYYPQNMVLVVAGKIELTKLDELIELIQGYFGSLQKSGRKITKPIKIKQEKPRLQLVTKKTEQAHFCLGIPGYPLKDRRRYALGVLATILGGGMSSRLFLEIRERRGLAYYVDCNPEFHTDSGYLVARGGIRLEKVEEAIKVTLDEFQKLTKIKVGKKELTKAKEFNKGGLILAMENSRNVAERHAVQLILENKIRPPEKTLALINKVTTEDIQRVARDLFKSEKLNLVIVGPYRDKKGFKDCFLTSLL